VTHIHTVELRPGPGRKTKRFELYAKEGTGALLGCVRWYGAWRCYSFFPEPSTLFERTCLREIADFLEDLTKAHRGSR
jgi:hypothetical protein